MEREPASLLEEALKLPQEARAALAASLLESLDETVDGRLSPAPLTLGVGRCYWATWPVGVSNDPDCGISGFGGL